MEETKEGQYGAERQQAALDRSQAHASVRTKNGLATQTVSGSGLGSRIGRLEPIRESATREGADAVLRRTGPGALAAMQRTGMLPDGGATSDGFKRIMEQTTEGITWRDDNDTPAPTLYATMDPTFRSPLVTDLDVAMGFEPRDAMAAGRLRREAEAALLRSFADGVLDLSREAKAAPLDERVLWEMGRTLEERGESVREVLLQGWKRPSDVALRALSLSVARLVQVLDLSRSNADGTCCRVLPARYFGLTATDLSGCPRLTDDCLSSVVKASHRTLTALDVSRCKGLGDDLFGWISGSVGPSMGAGCKSLLSLRASGTPFVRDRALGHLAEGCRQLRFLDVSHCGAITDEGVLALTAGCRHLQVVDIDSCDRLTDETFRALSTRCRRLRSLTAARLPLMTDRALWFLSRGCKELQAVDVASCYNITEKGLFFLARECPLLQQLRCDGDTLVSQKGLAALVKGLPRGETRVSERWHGIEPTRQMPRLRLARSALYLRDAAALSIQCAGRSYIARQRTGLLRSRQILRKLSKAAASSARDRDWRLYVADEVERRAMRFACLAVQGAARRWIRMRTDRRRAARRVVE